MKTKPTLQKFIQWISKELNNGNFSQTECQAMYQDFAGMSETRLKKLANNFNL